eukprot:g8651.t1
MQMERDGLKGLGEHIMKIMCEAGDDVLTEWLEAPFENAAARGDIPLTKVLKKAGAKGMRLRGLFEADTVASILVHTTMMMMGADVNESDGNGFTPLLAARASRVMTLGRVPFGGGGKGAGGELEVASSDANAFRSGVVPLVRTNEEGIFGNVVCFL